MFDLIDRLWDMNAKICKNVTPQPMSIVEVTTSKHVLKKMVVLKVEKNRCLCVFSQKATDSWPLQYDERNTEDL